MADQPLVGKVLRDNHFLYKQGYIPLNNGSFGAFPRVVRDKMIRLMDQCEENVDEYIRYDYPKMLEESREVIARLLKADPMNVVFVPNASTAFNTVLRSLVWKDGDVMIGFDICYSGFEKTVEYIVESTPASSVIVDINWPCEDDELIKKFAETVDSIKSTGRRPRLAVFDTVTSMPGIRLPFERLTRKCKDLGILSFLDGAQGIGQIQIDLGTVQPDFFCTNLHKWLFTPRGSAVLYVASEQQSLIRSSIPTSHGFQVLPKPGQRKINNPFPPASGSAFHELFQFVATTNNDAYLTVPSAVRFREEVCGGEQSIIDYHTNLARSAGDKAAAILGTEVFDNRSGTLRDCAFANIRLPLVYGDGEGCIPTAEVGQVQQFIAEESVKAKTFFAFIFYGGSHWWRISATVMLDEEDILWGANLMKELCDRVKKGDHRGSKSH